VVRRERGPVHDEIHVRYMAAETKVPRQFVRAMLQGAVS